MIVHSNVEEVQEAPAPPTELEGAKESEDFWANLERTLPDPVPRCEVDHLLKGIIASKTLANRDSKGTGPDGARKVFGKVCYAKAPFIEFIRANTVPADHKKVKQTKPGGAQ